MRTIKSYVMLLMMVMLCGFALPGFAVDEEVDGTPIPSNVARSYESNWRKYARYACEIDGGYGFFPNYDRRFPSSRGITTGQAMDELKIEAEVKTGNFVRKKVRQPPREDAEAYATALPDTRIGSYGDVASAQIVQVISRDEMIIRELWLVDRDKLREAFDKDMKDMERRKGEADKELLRFNYGKRIELMGLQEDSDAGFDETFRLIGYDTRGLRVGERWRGPNDEGFQVGVVRWETTEAEQEQESRRSRRRSNDARLVLTEMEGAMRQEIDGQGFKKLLADRGLSVVDFVAMVRDLRERDRANAEQRIHNALLPDDKLRDD